MENYRENAVTEMENDRESAVVTGTEMSSAKVPAEGEGDTAVSQKQKGVCLNCGNTLEDDQDFCPKCGTPRPKKTVCVKCGAELQPGQDFCPKCGQKVSETRDFASEQKPAQPSKGKKKNIIIVGAIVLIAVIAAVCWLMFFRISINSITLNEHELRMACGGEKELTYVIDPSEHQDEEVEWISEDPAVASVENGVVTAVGAGETTITARVGGKEDSVKTVVVDVNSITLNEHELRMVCGEEKELTYVIDPSELQDEEVEWISADPAVADVENGVVTAAGTGESTITVRVRGKEDSAKIVVVDINSITLNEHNLKLLCGEGKALTYVIDPSELQDEEVEWISADPNVASVRNGVVLAEKTGETKITVRVRGKEDSLIVTVWQDPILENEWELKYAAYPNDYGRLETVTAYQMKAGGVYVPSIDVRPDGTYTLTVSESLPLTGKWEPMENQEHPSYKFTSISPLVGYIDDDGNLVVGFTDGSMMFSFMEK